MPAETSIAELHDVLQTAFSWGDEHLARRRARMDLPRSRPDRNQPGPTGPARRTRRGSASGTCWLSPNSIDSPLCPRRPGHCRRTHQPRRQAQHRRIGYDPTDPIGKLLFTMLSVIAEFEADLPRMRTREGMAITKVKGPRQKPKLSPSSQETHRHRSTLPRTDDSALQAVYPERQVAHLRVHAGHCTADIALPTRPPLHASAARRSAVTAPGADCTTRRPVKRAEVAGVTHP